MKPRIWLALDLLFFILFLFFWLERNCGPNRVSVCRQEHKAKRQGLAALLLCIAQAIFSRLKTLLSLLSCSLPWLFLHHEGASMMILFPSRVARLASGERSLRTRDPHRSRVQRDTCAPANHFPSLMRLPTAEHQVITKQGRSAQQDRGKSGEKKTWMEEKGSRPGDEKEARTRRLLFRGGDCVWRANRIRGDKSNGQSRFEWWGAARLRCLHPRPVPSMVLRWLYVVGCRGQGLENCGLQRPGFCNEQRQPRPRKGKQTTPRSASVPRSTSSSSFVGGTYEQ